eukprot:Phypoly_transcript_02365.p1 GENE.Phypoly_transcript_02365~~Phypoly_transcript_02365.p1  ORF type:complete len:907 (+),score=163.85 Phypoly_transcript_02365:107-2722(+)
MSIETGVTSKRLTRKCDCIWALAAVRDEIWAACSDGDIVAYQRSNGKVLQKWQAHLGGTFCLVTNGEKIISGGADWVIRVWSGHGALAKCYFGHTNAVRCLLVVDDTLWSGADDRSIRVWPLQAQDVECLQELQGHTDSVLCMCKCDTVTPCTVWTSGADQTIRVWDQTYRCSHKLKSHKGWVTGLVVAGRTVWSSSADKTIVIWDVPGLRVKRTLRDHTAYLRGITIANYQIVSFAADRSIRFWHCTELYQGMIGRIQREVNTLAEQLVDKGKKEGEARATLVNCYSTIETLEREVESRRQAAKDRDDLRAVVAEMTSKMARLEKENQQASQLATQSWSASQEKLFSNNFQLFVDMIESDSSSDICTRCMLAVQQIELELSGEKVKLLQATQKMEEFHAKQAAQAQNNSLLESMYSSRVQFLEGQLADEKEKLGEERESIRRKEELMREREKVMQDTVEKMRGTASTEATAGLMDKLHEAEAKCEEGQTAIEALNKQIKEIQEENKVLNEKLAAGERELKSLRRRSKNAKEITIKMEDYIKHIADLEEQLAAAKNAPKPPPEEPMNSDRFTQKVRELEEALAHSRQERSDVARDYARRAIDLEQQILRAQQECAEYVKRCRELEQQLGKFEKASARDDMSTHSSISGIDEGSTQDLMKLIEEVETLNAEKRLQKQEMEEALRSKAELAKTVESLKQESLIKSQQQKPQSAIQSLIDKTHRLEAQLTAALKDNANLQKYQKEAQKQAELKQMIEGMITKVLDMETQLVVVTKERDEMNEELSQFKMAGVHEREEKQKLYAMQLALNQTRAQNNVLENELKTVREKLRREEEEGAKARLNCDHLTLRVAGLEELVKKMGNITTERSAIHSFY